MNNKESTQNGVPSATVGFMTPGLNNPNQPSLVNKSKKLNGAKNKDRYAN